MDRALGHEGVSPLWGWSLISWQFRISRQGLSNVGNFEAGLHAQNYDKACDRFVGKFDPDAPLEAVVSIVKGSHHDHGTAIYFTQEKRRCLLLDTLYGLSEEETLW
jgi:hypothetical protein